MFLFCILVLPLMTCDQTYCSCLGQIDNWICINLTVTIKQYYTNMYSFYFRCKANHNNLANLIFFIFSPYGIFQCALSIYKLASQYSFQGYVI